jgi:predicted transcriptional regulator
MAQTLLEMAKDLTRTLVETGKLSAEDMQKVLHKTHATLTALKEQEEMGAAPAVSVAESSRVDWRKSIRKHAVICLECDLPFKQLSRRHLMMYGLDPRSYRMKYGIPLTQPLAARSTTERRRQVAQATRPWEKTPRYRQGHAQNGTASSEPKAEAVQEKTEEPVTLTPVHPKRQRKTTSKQKTAGKDKINSIKQTLAQYPLVEPLGTGGTELYLHLYGWTFGP